jgi:energy-coupling factor transporter ATP-binding protein EcfA2
MMIKNLSIENFRGFQSFRMKELGRVNLIVGANNCGKTTVLEAINILMSHGNLATISTIHSRRGEISWLERNNPAGVLSRQYEVRRLFRGHNAAAGSCFRLAATTDTEPVELSAKIEEYDPAEPGAVQPRLLMVENPDEPVRPLLLSLSWTNALPHRFRLPISQPGTVGADAFNFASRAVGPVDFPVRFITASSLVAEVVSKLFDDIVLTPEEDLVIDTLRIIEPAIQRVASAGSEQALATLHYSPRGGIVVRLKDISDRVPIGSMGDGIWHVLGLALFVVQCRNGILLVDDVDAGIHHTVMDEVWKFLYSAARKYNVQIFAVTHSRDCYKSLATISDDAVSEHSDVTIQRIERGRELAVAYTEQEIIAAAQHDIEVR